MQRKLWLLIVTAALFTITSYSLAHSPPDNAKIFFKNIADGDVVQNPVTIKFGIKGFGVTAAGELAKDKHNAGHYHLLINVAKLPDLEEPIPYAPGYMHFDAGETETTLTLKPGEYTLQLMMGDEDHEPYDPPLISKKIVIKVE